MWLTKLPLPHADVGPLYQLQWANSRFKRAITLLTTLENSWNIKAAFIQLEDRIVRSIFDFFSRESETIGLD